ncbi:Sec23/Sec24 trunk domain containing protein [Trichomonas vaginalis G3]|uniref:Sec23/Sec24 trunk domain containing protein n=1 Tax=Trichomonas vaginalis (strain ATCC PRA-98 / G3) TaxID=412133 RepID=A2FMC3_TRIV3|nr:ER to Golgi vesicle-mediated transport [Trichomonas vaginalis G3]EAX93940.1 Sec23/Sec24 trunk domain containing protein [Trichomonas vaginalis G3]KAI5549067.1 ER to Golgi vesicle-mediated transport [Trichomonas vaginalis G3]|eukprot:XP_001306870.1 Sec23/Sec24 trunk domain containing protein [Trichomonas vaginalis G3]
MKINVHNVLTGKSVVIDCEPSETVGSLINRAKESFGYLSNQVVYFHGQVQLNLDFPISAYNIPDGGIVTINRNKNMNYAAAAPTPNITPITPPNQTYLTNNVVNVTSWVDPNQSHNYQIPWLNEKLLNPPSPSTSYFRFTTTTFPKMQSMIEDLKLPLGIAIRPADVSNQPIFDYQNIPLPRCKNCNCMLCPQVTFTPDNQKWICLACKTPNIIDNSIINIFEAPELKSQVYDVLVPPFTISKRDGGPAFAFVLDMSSLTANAGFTEQFICSLKASLDSMPQNAIIYLITVGKNLTFFDLRNREEIIMPDLTETNINVPSQPTLSEIREDLDQILDMLLYRLHFDTPSTGHCLGNGLQLATNALRKTGGIIIAVFVGVPVIGPYFLKDRHSAGPNEEVTLLKLPTDQTGIFWRNLAQIIRTNGISLHAFNAGPQFADLATDAVTTGLMSGTVHHYHTFDDSSREKLHTDLFTVLTKDYLWNAETEVKLTRGAFISRQLGNCTTKSGDNTGTYFGALMPDDSVVLELDYEERLQINELFIQVQLSFTDLQKVTHIRVFSFSVPVTTDLNIVRQNIDEISLMSIIIRRAAMMILGKGRQDCVNYIQSNMKELIKSKAAIVSIPYLLHSLLFSDLTRERHPDGIDGRLAIIIRIRSIDIISATLYLYPRLFALQEDGSYNVLPLKGSSFAYGTVFVLHMIDRIVVWVSLAAKPEFLMDLFDVDELTKISNEIPVKENPPNKALLEIIENSRVLSRCYLPVSVIPQGSSDEAIIGQSLFDDDSGNRQSFEEFSKSY